MANKKDAVPNPTYYVSPTGKIHADFCRYCQPDKEGWQKLNSLESGLEKNYQLCRLCCPSPEQIISSASPSDKVVENQDSENLSDNNPITTPEKPEEQTVSENTPSVVENVEKVENPENPENTENAENAENAENTEKKAPSEKNKVKSEKKTESKKEKGKKESSTNAKEKDSKKKSEPPTEKKRYKILAGNGCHQAIAEVLGILLPPPEGEKSFRLILPDGLQLEASFKNSRLLWLAYNKPELLGQHWFRGYPKMKDNKLVSLQIIAWDGAMPTHPRGDETWEFTGVWTLQKNITVQRSMMLDDVRKIAKETGFIKKFKYTFVNSFDWVKNKKLWAGYVYKVLCKRQGDVLEIKKVIPYACPRVKPVPKQAPPRGNKGNKPFNKSIKPKFSKK